MCVSCIYGEVVDAVRWAERDNLQAVVQDKELLTGVLHDISTQGINQISDCERAAILVGLGHGEGVAALVREEHLETASADRVLATITRV